MYNDEFEETRRARLQLLIVIVIVVAIILAVSVVRCGTAAYDTISGSVPPRATRVFNETAISQDEPRKAETNPTKAEDAPEASMQVEQADETPLPTPTTAPTVAASPVQAVREYWETTSRGQYEEGWAGLSTGFKNRKHGGDYTDYLEGYQAMNLCSVVATDVQLIQQSDNHAVVSAHLVYHASSNCKTSEYDFDFYLVRNSTNGPWLIDRLVPK